MTAPAAPSRPPVATPAALAGLAGLGAASALLALLLWAELVRSRSLGAPVCVLGESGSCAALWDSPFAAAVHGLSGLPVAGWGLVWGLVALALPLEALRRRAEGRDTAALVSAIRIAAAAGLVSVFVFVGIALAARSFCAGCSVTYLLVAGYAGIALFGWQPHGLPRRGPAAGWAGGATLVAYALLLYPGLGTPRSSGEADRAAIASAGRDAGAAGSAQVAELVESLDPRLRQLLADSLAIYRRSPRRELPPPRAPRGSPDARVRITDFTDVLCPACADLHRTLEQLLELAPEGSLLVDSRQFPLDASCNELVERGGEPVRCEAALARICLAGDERAAGFDAALFAEQETLDAARVREIAAGFVPREELERCLADAATKARLEEDVSLAARFQIEGTPLVVVNGRRGTSFGGFLYAMILTGGDPDDPAFRALPEPRPDAHIH